MSEEIDGCAEGSQACLSAGSHTAGVAGEGTKATQGEAGVAGGGAGEAQASADEGDVDQVTRDDPVPVCLTWSLPAYDYLLRGSN